MRRSSFPACSAVLIAAAFVAACHQAPKQAEALAPSPDESGRIGDSTTFGVHIVGFSGARNRVTFKLDEPAYVLALAVVPGKTIEPLGERPGPDAGLTLPGIHDIPIAVTGGPAAGNTPSQPRLVDQVDYQRCVDRNVRARRRPQRTSKPVRDSTGKVTYVETTELVEDLDAERRAERSCAGILKRRDPTTANATGPNALPQGDRFLVLLASNVQMTPQELIERLSAMTVTATDVKSTMEAIADALYFDRAGFWSGHYMRW